MKPFPLLLVALILLARVTCEAALTPAQVDATKAFLNQFKSMSPTLPGLWTVDDFCNWEGITCTAANTVEINLANGDLSGALPGFSEAPTNVPVSKIDLSGNYGITDAHEGSWGGLKKLEELDLSSTQLQGIIPVEWNGMTALRVVRVSDTLTCGPLPRWSIASLEVVDFSRNYLTGSLSDSWGSMSGLVSVNLQSNLFCGCVPASWASVPALQTALDNLVPTVPTDCSIAKTCTSYANGANCRQHVISTTSTSSMIPSTAAPMNADTLRFLQKLSSSFPFQLKSLWRGSSYCGWEGVVCDPKGFVTITLSGMKLAGILQDLDVRGIDGSKVLVTSIDLSDNPFIIGNLPLRWYTLQYVHTIDMSRTSISGALPDGWGRMPSLRAVRFSGAKLCGSTPNWDMSTLREIDISDNYMRGTLSDYWSHMSLESVKLRGNDFCGCIPESWGAKTVLSDAAAATDGKVTHPDCAKRNKCARLSHLCRDAAAGPMHTVFIAAVMLFVGVIAL